MLNPFLWCCSRPQARQRCPRGRPGADQALGDAGGRQRAPVAGQCELGGLGGGLGTTGCPQGDLEPPPCAQMGPGAHPVSPGGPEMAPKASPDVPKGT